MAPKYPLRNNRPIQAMQAGMYIFDHWFILHCDFDPKRFRPSAPINYDVLLCPCLRGSHNSFERKINRIKHFFVRHAYRDLDRRVHHPHPVLGEEFLR